MCGIVGAVAERNIVPILMDGLRRLEYRGNDSAGKAVLKGSQHIPRQRTVVHLTLTGPGAAQGWLDIARGAITVCTDDPGYDVDLAIEADTGQMQRWLVGLVPFRDLIANGYARLLGPSRLARAFPTWFDTTYFAEGLRRAELRHRRMAVPA